MDETKEYGDQEAHVFLGVFDFGDNPDVVTKIIGFEPTKVWIKGQSIAGQMGRVRNHSRWVLESPLESDRAIGDHLETLVSVLAPHVKGVHAIAERFSASIWCAVYYRTATPCFRLSPQLLSRIADLHLALDFELYFVGESRAASSGR